MNEGRRQYICDSSESRRRQYLHPIQFIFSCHCQFSCLEKSDILSLVQGQGQTRCVNLKWPISVLTRLVMCVCFSLRIRLGESTMGYWSFNQERCISPNALILQYEIRGPISKDIVAPTRVHSHKGNICRNDQMFVEQIRRAVQCQLADKEKFDITIVCITR